MVFAQSGHLGWPGRMVFAQSGHQGWPGRMVFAQSAHTLGGRAAAEVCLLSWSGIFSQRDGRLSAWPVCRAEIS